MLARPARRALTSVPVKTIPASTDSSMWYSKRARRFVAMRCSASLMAWITQDRALPKSPASQHAQQAHEPGGDLHAHQSGVLHRARRGNRDEKQNQPSGG